MRSSEATPASRVRLVAWINGSGAGRAGSGTASGAGLEAKTASSLETSESAESREFNAILRKDGAKAAIAWRSARVAGPSSGTGS